MHITNSVKHTHWRMRLNNHHINKMLSRLLHWPDCWISFRKVRYANSSNKGAELPQIFPKERSSAGMGIVICSSRPTLNEIYCICVRMLPEIGVFPDLQKANNKILVYYACINGCCVIWEYTEFVRYSNNYENIANQQTWGFTDKSEKAPMSSRVFGVKMCIKYSNNKLRIHWQVTKKKNNII